MFKRLRELQKRIRVYNRNSQEHGGLDILLSTAGTQELLEEKLNWLVKLLQWLRHTGRLEGVLDTQSEKRPLARLRFFLMVLDRHPLWKKEVAALLREVIQQLSGLELYAETGLPRELGLLGELWHRLMMKALPIPPLEQDLGHLFWALFPDEKDPQWISSVDEATFSKVLELFYFEAGDKPWNRLAKDMEDALLYLVIQTRAIGLSPVIRHRMDKKNFRDSAFYILMEGTEEFMAAVGQGPSVELSAKAAHLRSMIWDCRREMGQVYDHLDEYGVSINIVFQMERLKTYLFRIDNLIEVLITEKLSSEQVTLFVASLVQDNQELRSLGTLLSQNVALLARKVVERAAATGEHYITRSKKEYWVMLKMAAGGGILTAFTVYIKIWILSLPLSHFFKGVFLSLNYGVSFVAIMLCGFTLATKQPAMTAPALAAKMREVNTAEGMTSLVDEVAHLIRSQMAAVVGNVLFVVPMALIMDLVWLLVSGNHLMSAEQAHHSMEMSDIWGPVVIFACFTGVLLWLSSIFAGWGDNWFALYGLRRTLARSPKMRAFFGKMGARRIAVFFEKNMSGLIGNISLGILMGMTPEIMNFFGLPLEVRHVTLSSGTVAGALPLLGVEIFSTPEFWRVVAGIALTGLCNITVSFGMALWVALRARNLNKNQKSAIRKAVLSRFFKHPLTFFFPVGPSVKGLIDEANTQA